MSQPNRVKIEPDLDFVQDIIQNGGESLKKCFQCGTCSVVCNLSPDDHPFPRQEMIWAQWGLKDKLTADPHVWTCYQCSDCSTYCPRGAKPGDVLAAVRRKVIEGLAFPSFMGRAVADPHYWAWLFLFPAMILLAIIMINGAGFMTEHPIVYGNMISHIQMNLVFPLFSALAGIAFLVGMDRLWRGASGQSLISFLPQMDYGRMFTAARDVITGILTHKDFDKCDTNKWRRLAHLLVFYAFIGLLATTALAIVVLVVYEYLNKLRGLPGHNEMLGVYPMEPLHPIKWLGNASAAALILGSGLMIWNRAKLAKSGDITSSAFDNFFLWTIFGVGVTGFLAQIFRFLEITPIIAYATYFAHLVLVFALLIYSPYSKFAHFVYRTVALIHKRYAELEAAEQAAPEAEAKEAQAA
ncbi:MAG TPA: quinone-interacting membrane-bound oxidoreductase complex subunit QmoC [bacterium]|nr:quinone-interacting membrane-bound oxidoreductase complex subunit QmoC [bacterium]